MTINGILIRKVCGVECNPDIEFYGLYNLSHKSTDNFLSWLNDIKYLEELENNPLIKGVFTDFEISKNIRRSDLQIIICDDPLASAFLLSNYITKQQKIIFKSDIAKTAKVSPLAYICKNNVIIGENCIIEPFVTIMENVEIGNNVIIRAGARIGADNFDRHLSKNGNVIRLDSIQKVILKNGCEIGSNTVIDKGDSGRDTSIGENTMIHDNVQVCHGVIIGDRTHIWGGAFFCGHCTIGNDVKIQPRSIISNHVIIEDKCYVGINSLVTQNLEIGSSFFGMRKLQSLDKLNALKDRFTK
jgi:UDP-3-O-[3-hydroxymyristoyl] glucosamine N-acyltransferase